LISIAAAVVVVVLALVEWLLLRLALISQTPSVYGAV
jgi:hypothetical protein